MIKRNVYSTLAFVIMTFSLFSACATQGHDRQAPTNIDSSKAVLQLLLACPSSTYVDLNDDTTCRKIVSTMEEIAHYDTHSVREAMSEYVNDFFSGTLPKYTKSADLFNMGLLNRVMFNVPKEMDVAAYQRVDSNVLTPIRPIEHGKIQLLWPLSRDSNGVITLKGKFALNMVGAFLNPLDEFDDFEKRFGRRYANEYK